MDFSRLVNRYVVEGKLHADNIHIGSGRASGDEDAPTIRYSNGLAYIPGSSFRGHLRAKLEGIVALGLQVDGRDIDELDIKTIFGYTNLEEKDIIKLKDRRSIILDKDDENKKEWYKRYTSLAGKIHIEDLKIEKNRMDIARDGIAIDRNTGTTKKGAKFDYNVLEDATFNLRMTIENAMEHELDLLNVAFNMMKEDIFGGKTSRGIGMSKLDITGVKYASNKDELKNYLFKGVLVKGKQDVLVKGKITL